MPLEADLSGAWSGEIAGTNAGNVLLDIQQMGEQLSGVARISDSRFGLAAFDVAGVAGPTVSLQLTPRSGDPGVAFGPVTVAVQMAADGSLSGRWESSIGTAGTVVVHRQPQDANARGRKVFVVHGHDQAAKEAVARLLEKLDLEPVVLGEQPSLGQTVIEKFEQNSDVAFAVVLLTPDDSPHGAPAAAEHKFRARQNVILELGYFIGRLGRSNVCALRKGDVEIPSDYHGVMYIPMDDEQSWKIQFAAELRGAGLEVDLNRLA